MSETVQQIKEQVMNLARRPTISASNDTNDDSDENDYILLNCRIELNCICGGEARARQKY
ncbi:hypothetical protein H5410_053400 [Solanum commersonii]|uniref:Uncharacterized protein n=1 Tax=Solanum commersonii TaxID=4109 RepID=A0A9J5X5S9_SOLCO|nr:hypothetical protein H5410_053400 [Solanum commersonii]